jgi:hypothetical protein
MAAAMATAVVSEPPRPRVVMSPSSSSPWKPATTAISPRFSESVSRSASMERMRALAWALSVRIRTWGPVKLRAFPPCPWMARAVSPMLTCSPVAATTSCSRSSGRGLTSRVRFSRRFVSPAIAETTTTTSWPSLWVSRARRATPLMRSVSFTEVPPYFWTMSAKHPPHSRVLK